VNPRHEIIAADIGNSSMTLCLMRGLEIFDTVDTSSKTSASEMAEALKDLPRDVPLVVASVSPDGLAALEQAWGKHAFAFGRDGTVPIENRTRTPSQAGQDRLCNALAAKHREGGDAIVVDFGSAITFDVVKDGAYVGGLIAPGIGMAMEALHQKTALLPLVELSEREPPLIGDDTAGAINAGVYHGYIGLATHILARLMATYDSKPHVIATGGYGVHLAPRIEGIEESVPELTHEGIALAWSEFHSRRLRRVEPVGGNT
jgi:type III pantothenate kinase